MLFTNMLTYKKNLSSIEMFTFKRLDQDLGLEESNSRCLTPRVDIHTPRLFYQDVGNAIPHYLLVRLHVEYFTSEK